LGLGKYQLTVASPLWLICFVEVMGSNANNAKAWRETVGVEDAWTYTARD